ncbi:MAG: hypothetical protein EBS53_17475 [Bacteroidetes bacterium]|nr:hypothetical protein [Bacteroidota bacterium]
MRVMIAKVNMDIIRGFYPRAKFVENSRNTCLLKISEAKFHELYKAVRDAGYNPFSLLYW